MRRVPDACRRLGVRTGTPRHSPASTRAWLQVVENVVAALHAALPHLPKQWSGVKVRGAVIFPVEHPIPPIAWPLLVDWPGLPCDRKG